jgi:hypothetical protein
MVNAHLIDDIYSMFHKNGKPILMGKKGERVGIVSEHGDILIVESERKNRFSLNKKLVLYADKNSKGEDPLLAKKGV